MIPAILRRGLDRGLIYRSRQRFLGAAIGLRWRRFISGTRATKLEGLKLLAHLGFAPKTVIDVGAHKGTHELYAAFPAAHHVMLEPVLEYERILRKLSASLASAEVLMAAAGATQGAAQIWVSDNSKYAGLTGSRGEGEDPPASGQHRIVDSITLDSLVASRDYAAPFLVKIDVDGAELEVLAGSAALLTPETVFAVEATFIDPEPRFGRLIDFFYARGFVVYDIVDFLYRPGDDALWQVDLIFVHTANPARRAGPYR